MEGFVISLCGKDPWNGVLHVGAPLAASLGDRDSTTLPDDCSLPNVDVVLCACA
jgi:hypothetical protein